MSSEAIAWAIRCDIREVETSSNRAAVKGLLMIVSDLANHTTGEVYASNEYLQRASGLSKKTVLSAIDDLIDMKVLEVTDDRRGKTLQIPVYIFHMNPDVPMIETAAERKRGANLPSFEKRGRKGVQSCTERGADLPVKGVQNCYPEPSSRNQEEEQTPPTPNGVGTPTEDLFNGSLPVIAETPLDEFVESTWAELKEAYPSVAGIGLLSPARKTKIGARANEIVAAMRKKGEAITPREVWRRVIVDRIPRSRFLTGQAPPGKGYTAPMKLNIDYVLRPAEFLKIFIGDYDDDKRPGAISEYASDGRRYGPTEAALRAEIERL